MTFTMDYSKKSGSYPCDSVKKKLLFLAVLSSLMVAHDASARRRLLPEAPSVEIHYEALIGLQNASMPSGAQSVNGWQKGPDGIAAKPEVQKPEVKSKHDVPIAKSSAPVIEQKTKQPEKVKPVAALPVLDVKAKEPKLPALPVSKTIQPSQDKTVKSNNVMQASPTDLPLPELVKSEKDISPKTPEKTTKDIDDKDKKTEIVKVIKEVTKKEEAHKVPSLASIPPVEAVTIKPKTLTKEEFLAGADSKQPDKSNDVPVIADKLPELPPLKPVPVPQKLLKEEVLSKGNKSKEIAEQAAKIKKINEQSVSDITLPTPAKPKGDVVLPPLKQEPIEDKVPNPVRLPINKTPASEKLMELPKKEEIVKEQPKPLVKEDAHEKMPMKDSSKDVLKSKEAPKALPLLLPEVTPTKPEVKLAKPDAALPKLPALPELPAMPKPMPPVKSEGNDLPPLAPKGTSDQLPEVIKKDDKKQESKELPLPELPAEPKQDPIDAPKKRIDPNKAAHVDTSFMSRLGVLTKDLISRKKKEDTERALQKKAEEKGELYQHIDEPKTDKTTPKDDAKSLALAPVLPLPQTPNDSKTKVDNQPSALPAPPPLSDAQIALPPINGVHKKQNNTESQGKGDAKSKVVKLDELPSVDLLKKKDMQKEENAKLPPLPKDSPFGVVQPAQIKPSKPIAAPVTAVEVSNDLPPLKPVTLNENKPQTTLKPLPNSEDQKPKESAKKSKKLGSLNFAKSEVKLKDAQQSNLAALAKSINAPIVVVAYAVDDMDNVNARHEALARALAVRGALIDSGVASKLIRTEVKSDAVPKGLESGVDIIPAGNEE